MTVYSHYLYTVIIFQEGIDNGKCLSILVWWVSQSITVCLLKWKLLISNFQDKS